MALQKRITARKTPKYCKHYKKNKGINKQMNTIIKYSVILL